MAVKSALASFVSLMHGDRASTIDAATQAFIDDFAHFARANNREPLNVAIAALKKAPKDKAIVQAINDAYKASGLTVGYIGAKDGKFSAQPDSVQATFNDAIKVAGEAFKLSLESSVAFADKVAKTQEEKTKAKEERTAKASEALENAITAKVQAGELVRASDVKKLEDFHVSALFDALVSGCAGDFETLGTYAAKLLSLATETTRKAQEATAIREEAEQKLLQAEQAATPRKGKAKKPTVTV